MSYCIHPACPHPQNPDDATTCQACNSRLVLRKRYQIVKPLGKGGFGATFLARDLSLPGVPSCVVKQLRPTAKSPRVLEMAQQLFQREAKTLGKIGNHPQLPRLLDYFVGKQQFYLVQEYIDGCTLKQEVKSAGVYNEEQTQTFIREILPILDYIHFQGVIHRDIKPANILRRRQDNNLVLIDFGAVKDEVSQVSLVGGTGETAFTNFAIGTNGFAPPEQMSLRPVYASDIYAVGMSCIYLLTGQSPNRLQHDPMTGELQWRSQITVSDGFAQILHKMLEMSVRHRYQSAQEVLDALDALAFPTVLETQLEDLSSGLSIQPVVTTFSEDRIDSVLEEEPTIYKEDSIPSPSPFASEASQIRDLITRRSQKVSVSNSNLGNGYGDAFSATQGAPRISVRDKEVPNKSNRTSTTPASGQEEWNERRLRSAYIRGERYFTECDLRGFNLEKAKFSGAYFSECQLNQTNFQGADLSKVNFSRARLNYAILRDANLKDAYLSTANLEGADLRGANLHGACLRRANLRGANLCGADLTNALVSKEQIAFAKTNWRTIKPDGKRAFGL